LKFELLPPLTTAPPARSFWQDFTLLLTNQLRVTWNKIRHWPRAALVGTAVSALLITTLLVYLGGLSHGLLQQMNPGTARGFLSLIFLTGFGGVLFFGITAAFATLYMSDDLELLFMAPVSTRAVFAVKSLVVAGGNAVTVLLFVFLPALFYGLLFGAGPLFYPWAVLVGLGLWASGTAVAELLNLLVMRIVPPHRSREAVGVLGGLGGLLIALFFQIPNLVMQSSERFDPSGWLDGQHKLFRLMDYFPWGWGSRALAAGAVGDYWIALGWILLLLFLSVLLLVPAFSLVERGFRHGWISLSREQGAGRRKRGQNMKEDAGLALRDKNGLRFLSAATAAGADAPAWRGMWAVAKKDLLYLKRDSREWFGYLIPLIILAFFIAQNIFLPGAPSRSSLVTILALYTIMFSGNMAAQSFGREGESEWILNSVPLAGWSVVWGKLLAAVLPTLVLMELMLLGTALTMGLSARMMLLSAAGALLLTLAASAVGLFFSINHCRYHPDNPRQRIAPGAAWLMFLLNLILILLMAAGLLIVFAPAELTGILTALPPLDFSWNLSGILLYLLSLLIRPFFWAPLWRVTAGVSITTGVWAAFFYGAMAATVRQSRKGFRVEMVTAAKKNRLS
jgi:ABC-2 type transport system permease protein